MTTQPSYDDRQVGAVRLSWRCCLREVWATDPVRGCAVCREENQRTLYAHGQLVGTPTSQPPQGRPEAIRA
jgi:hypothetical protein